jgi:hypothetical protein
MSRATGQDLGALFISKITEWTPSNIALDAVIKEEYIRDHCTVKSH